MTASASTEEGEMSEDEVGSVQEVPSSPSSSSSGSEDGSEDESEDGVVLESDGEDGGLAEDAAPFANSGWRTTASLGSAGRRDRTGTTPARGVRRKGSGWKEEIIRREGATEAGERARWHVNHMRRS